MTRPVSERDGAGAWPRGQVGTRLVAVIAVVLAAATLSGCGSISEKFRNVASEMPAVGLPAGAPERPADPVAFPAVHDIPPPRNSTTLNDIEQAQAQKELVAARDSQQTAGGIQTQAQKRAAAAAAASAKPAPAKTPAAASSSATIY